MVIDYYEFMDMCVFFWLEFYLYLLELMFYFQDQFDTIDFSDNEIRKLDGFPLLRRLKNVILNNNRVWWVACII